MAILRWAFQKPTRTTPGPFISIIYNKDDRNGRLDDAHNVTG
ncbi:MAG TPA: hypothetical protein VKA34_06630 [Balneolales bacterium]|nr:hypothetical protein [Balneolales bacterium]